MISRYTVYYEKGNGEMDNLAEFDELETAMDFVEFYRRRYPDRCFGIKGISYQRTNVSDGPVITKWDPIPQELLQDEIANLLNWIAAGVDEDGPEEEDPDFDE